MDGKTKFLVSIVVLATVYGIGMAYYKYIVLKNIDLYYIEEEGGEETVEEAEESVEEIESAAVEEAVTEEGDGAEVVETGLEIQVNATSSATTTTSAE